MSHKALGPADLSFTFRDFDTEAFLIIKYCCNTPQVNADELGYIAVMHGHVTVQHRNVYGRL